jgi:hypothetical protein
MAGLEVVVRPVVFPNIRPMPARSLAPEDDPEKGIATLSGASGALIDLAFSETQSWSKSKMVETKRRVDVERVKQKEKDPTTGEETINEENYVDVERMNKLWERDGKGVVTERRFAEPDYQAPERDNIEVLEKDKMIINANLPPESGGGGAAP